MGTIRELTAHRVNGLNEALRIFVLDQPGSGGACHEYVVLVPAFGIFGAAAPPKDRITINTQPDSFDLKATTKNGETVMFGSLKDGNEEIAIIQDNEFNPPKIYRVQRISFQNGPIAEAGHNGNSHEALIAILLDRMEGFQAGQYACHDNQMALDFLQMARLVLHKRTMDRVARGVEGTHQK